jgi:predicted phosphoribosyltransferase/dienelactone hydrolase
MLRRHDLVEDIIVHAGAVDLRGGLAVPQGPVGLVIIAYAAGNGRSSPRNRYVAEALRARGLATLLIDLLTDTEEHLDRIDSSLRFDIDMLAERLLAITSWVSDESSLGHLPLAYMGDGTSAAAALCAASRRPEAIRAIVSRSGRADLAGSALPLVRAPTLFVVGGNDHAVLELDRAALDRMSTLTQLAVIPGSGHHFEEPGALDEVAQLSAEWFVDQFARALPELPSRRGTWGRQFRDRRQAGERLAGSLLHLASRPLIVCGLPRGGVPVADEVAMALHAPLDVWLVRKIGMPIQPEIGMGALAEGAALVLDEQTVRWSGVAPDELRSIVHKRAAEIRRRARLYRGDGLPPDVHGKTVILVDDGIATGGTLRAAIHGARKRGAPWVVVAAPVAAADAAAALRKEADEVICLSTPQHLMSVGAWYQDFHQLPESEVLEILAEARRRTASFAQVREPRATLAW